MQKQKQLWHPHLKHYVKPPSITRLQMLCHFTATCHKEVHDLRRPPPCVTLDKQVDLCPCLYVPSVPSY